MSNQMPLEGLANYQLSDRTRIIQALAEFRREWQRASSGQSLLSVKVPIGLLFSDIADWLELSPQERHVVLGSNLINEVDAFLESRVTLKTPL